MRGLLATLLELNLTIYYKGWTALGSVLILGSFFYPVGDQSTRLIILLAVYFLHLLLVKPDIDISNPLPTSEI